MITGKIRDMSLVTIIVIILFVSGLNQLILFHSSIKSGTLKAESAWIITTDTDFNNGTLNDLTICGNNTEAVLKLIFENISWKQKFPKNKPVARFEHCMTPVYRTDKVILFGGLDNSKLRNDTWEFDLSDNNWTEKTPKKGPSARAEHKIASIYGTDKIILFGGNNGTNNFLNDTWLYNCSNNTWIDMKPLNKPTGRIHHAIASVYGTDKVVLFGGGVSWWQSQYNCSNETWVYDLSDNNWTKKTPKNNPGYRFIHSMASVYSTDKVCIFGGTSSGPFYFNDTWIYDLSDDNWYNMNPPGDSPSPRIRHDIASIYDTDKIILFGGYDSKVPRDTWIYDFGDNKWREQYISKRPNSGDWHGMSTIYGQEKVLLFGGYWGKPLDESWIFTLHGYLSNGIFFSNNFDTGTNSSFKKIIWDANTSFNSSLEFQLRTAKTELGLYKKNFVGPDGTIKTSYNLSSTTIWSEHNGDRWIQYKIYFNTKIDNETPILKDVKIIYNCLPLTNLFSPTDNSIYVYNKPIFKWNFTDQDSVIQTGFQVIIDDRADFVNIKFDSGEQNSNDQLWRFPQETSYTELPDGIWYWKVRTKDYDGDWGGFSSTFKIIIDANAPNSNISSPINQSFHREVCEINGEAFDHPNGTGINKVEIKIKNVHDNHHWNGIEWVKQEFWLLAIGTTTWLYNTSSIIWTSGEQFIVQTRAIDKANNIEKPTFGYVLNIDQEKPISKIKYPINNSYLNRLNQINGTSEDIGGATLINTHLSIVSLIDNTINNKYWNGYGWTDDETWLDTIGLETWHYIASDINWLTDTYYSIGSKAVDKVYNTEIPKQKTTFMFDNKPPIEHFVFINNNDTYTNSPNVILSIGALDTGSGVDQIAFCLDNNKWSEWKLFNYTCPFSFPANDGEKVIYLKVRDHAGNVAKPVLDNIILDTIPPYDLSIIINNNNKFTNSNLVSLKLTSNDSLSGVDQMQFSFNTLDWTEWELFNEDKILELPVGDGQKKVYFRVKDMANNIAEWVFANIVLDTTPPENLSILLNNNDEFTNSRDIESILIAYDTLSGIYGMSFSMDGISWSEWEDFNSYKILKLPFGDGEKKVYFRVKDHAENFANSVFDNIILDTTPPHSLSIIINNSTLETNSTFINLNLNAIDDLSGISQMAFYESGKKWTYWETFKTEKIFNLTTNNGEKVIYFKVKDRVGNIAKPVSVKIILNTSTSQTEDIPKQDTKPKTRTDQNNIYWWFLLISVIILIVILLFLFTRKKKVTTVPQPQKIQPTQQTLKQIPPQPFNQDKHE